jgi:hypothetical protein
LESLADWIVIFAKGFRTSVTLDDYERLLGCMPPGRNLKTYRLNIKNLFWPAPGQRARGFLSQFTATAYEDAFNMVLNNPPDEGWNLKLIMNQIHDRGIVCKSVMLHVGFWFDPDLEEPANRANVKPPMFHHLKLAFSKYDPSHLMYEADESWKPEALELQRVVLKFTLQKWPKSNAIIGNLGMLRDMSPQKYGEYISIEFWNDLLHEVRSHTNAPFRHPSLVRIKNVNDLPPVQSGTTQIHDEVDIKEFRGQVGNVIRDEYSDRQALDSEEGEGSLEDGDDSTFVSQYTGRDGLGYAHADSPPQEALAVESEDEQDIIHVQTPSPAHSNPSKRRKVEHMNEHLGYLPVYDDQYALPQKPLRKIVKLKLPEQRYAIQTAHDLVERPRSFARKRPVTHVSPVPQTVQEPSPTISAPSHAPSRATPVVMTLVAETEPYRKDTPRTSVEQHSNAEYVDNAGTSAQNPEPAIQQISWEEAERERETARRALDECEGSTKSINLSGQDPEERPSITEQPFYRPRKHNFLPADRTSTSNAPTPSPAPPLLSHQPFFAQTPVAASPVLSTNKTEQAILVLQDEFGETLQIGEMLAAIKFLKNDMEAGIFLTLKPGALRNAWLWDGIKDDIKAV